MPNLLVVWGDHALAGAKTNGEQYVDRDFEAWYVAQLEAATVDLGSTDVLLTTGRPGAETAAREVAQRRGMVSIEFRPSGMQWRDGRETLRSWLHLSDDPDVAMVAALEEARTQGWWTQPLVLLSPDGRTGNDEPGDFLYDLANKAEDAWALHYPTPLASLQKSSRMAQLRGFGCDDLLWIDTETTGLSGDCAMIEIALVRTSASGKRFKGSFHRKIAIPSWAKVEPQALAINRYSDAEWNDAPSMDDVLREAIEEGMFDMKPRLAGHNTSFDLRFLRDSFARCGLEMPPIQDDYVCTKKLGQRLTPKPNLANLCTMLGVSNNGAHRALADVHRAREVFLRLA